jgi:hypothetical protein
LPPRLPRRSSSRRGRLSHTVYIRGSHAFYAKVVGASAASQLEGKWLSAPVTAGSFASFQKLTDMQTFLDALLDPPGFVEKGKEKLVDG